MIRLELVTAAIVKLLLFSFLMKSIVPIGSAVHTPAGHLKAKYIIHVITPIWNGGSNQEEAKLGECVLNA